MIHRINHSILYLPLFAWVLHGDSNKDITREALKVKIINCARLNSYAEGPETLGSNTRHQLERASGHITKILGAVTR